MNPWSWDGRLRDLTENSKRGRGCRKAFEAIAEGNPLKLKTWVALT
jgi:hypothetical protein